jgi:site-specific recombinase XerD
MTTLQQHFEAFVRSGVYLRAWSPKTVETYRRSFSSLQQSLAARETAPAEADAHINKARLEAWVISMRQRKLSPGGCNVYMRSMNSFCSWLHEQELTPQRLRLKLLPNPRKPLRGLSDAEVRTILTFRPKGPIQLRTWTLSILSIVSLRYTRPLNVGVPSSCDSVRPQ